MVEIHPLTLDDVWLRDTGPTFVISKDYKEVRGVNWIFNKFGSGAPLEVWKEDATVR